MIGLAKKGDLMKEGKKAKRRRLRKTGKAVWAQGLRRKYFKNNEEKAVVGW